MPETDPHAVDPADEGRHEPEADPLWNESHYLDFVSAEGALAGYVRIGLYPNLGVTWWTTMVVGTDRPLVASVAYDLPVGAGSGLLLRAEGYAIDGVVESPLLRMRLEGSAPAAVMADPAAVYRGEPGTPTALSLDLTWRTDGVPYHYDVTTRYEVPCLVGGTVTVGDDVLTVEGHGQRDHSWGVRDWWAFGWCWLACRLDDGSRVHAADIRIPGHPLAFGYLQHPGGAVVPVDGLAVTEELGEHGLPRRARARIDPGGLDLAIEPLAFGPLVLEAPDGRVSRFPRALSRFTASDGRAGTGWIEWCQTGPRVGGE